MSLRLRQPLVREAVLSAAAAAAIAAALAWFGPPGTDFAAHAYQRAAFLDHGFTLWNNYWYAGRYSFVTYSVFYYPLAALLGIRLLAVATVALAGRGSLLRNWVPVVGVGIAGIAEIAVWRIFPGSGHFPFSAPELAAGVAFCVVGLGLTWRVESARVLRFAFAVYLLAIVATYVIPSAIGENVARLRYAAIPLVILVFSLRRWQPRLVGVIAIALAVAWNISPLAYSLARNTQDVTTQATTWSGAIAFLKTHLDPSYRVEAVDTVTHSAAVYLAQADIPLARGWY